jgi:hypothetical protein
MARNENKWLGRQFADAVSRGFGRFLDFAFTAGPSVYQPSQWKEPAIQHNDTPTADLIAGLDRDKVIHLNDYYKIADALSWEIGMYFISKKDTATFLMPFSSDLAFKADRGQIESWQRRDFRERRRDIYYVRVGDLLDHIAENPLPGDNWEVKTLERKGMFAGDLRHRPLQIRKLMVVSAVLADDRRADIAAAAENFIHQPKGAKAAPEAIAQPAAP